LHEDFPAAHNDGVALLQIIKRLTYSFEDHRFLADALTDVKENFYGFRQGRHMSLQRYHELFLAQVQVLDEVSVSITNKALVNDVAVRNGNVGPDGKVIAPRRRRSRVLSRNEFGDTVHSRHEFQLQVISYSPLQQLP
jgi:hypothetical protein